MPTISVLRRRGYTPESVRDFAERISVARRDNLIDVALLEFCVREHLNKIALRRMVVFDPVKVIITNYNANNSANDANGGLDGDSGTGSELVKVENNPEDTATGHRDVTFSNEIYIEREDFMENPPKKYFR